MKIQHEIVDNEDYVDVLLTPDELRDVRDFYILSDTVNILGKKINLGIALTLKQKDIKSAAHKKQKQESDK